MTSPIEPSPIEPGASAPPARRPQDLPGPPPVESVRGVTLQSCPASWSRSSARPAPASPRCCTWPRAGPAHLGHRRIAGQDIAGLTDRAAGRAARPGLGVVFQQFFLLDGLSAVDNVATGLLYQAVPPRAPPRSRAAALDRVGPRHRLRTAPAALRRRAAARRDRPGTGRDPAIVLADEPTGNLDPATGPGDRRPARRAEPGRGVTTGRHHPRPAGRRGRRPPDRAARRPRRQRSPGTSPPSPPGTADRAPLPAARQRRARGPAPPGCAPGGARRCSPPSASRSASPRSSRCSASPTPASRRCSPRSTSSAPTCSPSPTGRTCSGQEAELPAYATAMISRVPGEQAAPTAVCRRPFYRTGSPGLRHRRPRRPGRRPVLLAVLGGTVAPGRLPERRHQPLPRHRARLPGRPDPGHRQRYRPGPPAAGC